MNTPPEIEAPPIIPTAPVSTVKPDKRIWNYANLALVAACCTLPFGLIPFFGLALCMGMLGFVIAVFIFTRRKRTFIGICVTAIAVTISVLSTYLYHAATANDALKAQSRIAALERQLEAIRSQTDNPDRRNLIGDLLKALNDDLTRDEANSYGEAAWYLFRHWLHSTGDSPASHKN